MSVLPKHQSKTLKNGLEVVVIDMKNDSNVINTDIFYKVGSGDEIMGKSGIAHMLEHLNFKSTKNLKAGEFDEIVKGYGGVNNASTGFDYTHYFIKSSSSNLESSLKLFAELMQNLKLKDKEFQPERDVVLEERRWRTENSPIGHLYFELFNHAFVYHPYHWTPIGFKADIENWSIKDIKKFHKKFYSPSNAILLVAGDVEPQAVFELAKRHFEHIKPSSKLEKSYLVEPEQNGEKRVQLYKESETQMIAIAYKIPDFKHEDQVALSALSELLASGKSSELYRVLVDEKKLVNQIYAYNLENKDPSLFLFIAICNENVEATAVKSEILNIIEDIKNAKFSDEVLTKIKTNTRANFIYSLENSSSVANLYGSYLARGDLEPLLNYESNINKLSKEQIVEVAKKYLIKSKSTTIMLKKDER